MMSLNYTQTLATINDTKKCEILSCLGLRVSDEQASSAHISHLRGRPVKENHSNLYSRYWTLSSHDDLDLGTL